MTNLPKLIRNVGTAKPLQVSREGCPGTDHPQLSCSTVSAIAAVRQADSADRAANVASFEAALGIATVAFAYLAARWAKRAAQAGTGSYKAFVAAEDASLIVEFPTGTIMQISEDGQSREEYVLRPTITNVGRSTARVHSVWTKDQEIAVGKTLRRDEDITLEESLWVDGAAEAFHARVHYSSPLTSSVALHIEVGLNRSLAPRGRVVATITKASVKRAVS